MQQLGSTKGLPTASLGWFQPALHSSESVGHLCGDVGRGMTTTVKRDTHEKEETLEQSLSKKADREKRFLRKHRTKRHPK